MIQGHRVICPPFISNLLHINQLTHTQLLQPNKVFHAISMKDLQIEVSNGAMSNKVLLKDTLHASDLCLTVVSIGRIVKAGYTMQFAGNSCNIKRTEDDHIIGCILASMNGLFRVKHAFAATGRTRQYSHTAF
jgi:hypothetical protein